MHFKGWWTNRVMISYATMYQHYPLMTALLFHKKKLKNANIRIHLPGFALNPQMCSQAFTCLGVIRSGLMIDDSAQETVTLRPISLSGESIIQGRKSPQGGCQTAQWVGRTRFLRCRPRWDDSDAGWGKPLA